MKTPQTYLPAAVMRRAAVLFCISALIGMGAYLGKMSPDQVFVICVFSCSILGTLLFWDFRLAFVFTGGGILVLTRSVGVKSFIEYASLDVIVFLIGMMIVVGMVKEAGFFSWLVKRLLAIRNIGGIGLFIIIMILSAVLSGLTGEVTSIIVMAAAILDISDLLEIDPVPLIISSVMTTNIGSASTLLGNPIGILIALRGNLTFEDFLTQALPLSALVLAAVIMILCVWYRKYLRDITSRLVLLGKEKQTSRNIAFDSKKICSVVLFGLMVILIAMHKRLEIILGIRENELLVVLPIIFAGLSLLCFHHKALFCIEHEVEWKSLLFFMFLFAQAGVVQASGVAQFLAEKFLAQIGSHPKVLVGVTLFSSGVLSGILDNTVVVASYIPVVKNLHLMDSALHLLWWALLFGACFGGNITAIGSTANIVALGILEKERNIKINFVGWLKLGLVIGIVSMAIAYLALLWVPIFPA
jgi:Na+/H+ antiporter NhaD/arsenite permease-like protein